MDALRKDGSSGCVDSFPAFYAKAKAFVDTYGHFPSFSEDKQLNAWARRAHMGGDEEQRRMVAALGYVYRSRSEYTDQVWKQKYLQAKAFFDVHGHFPRKRDDMHLYGWAVRWRGDVWRLDPARHARQGSLLESIGFTLKTGDDIRQDAWLDKYQQCKAFFDEHGHFPGKRDGRLWLWAYTWYRDSSHRYPERVKMLEAIGFTPGGRWMRNFCACRAFFDRHGRFPHKRDDMHLYGWAVRWWRRSFDFQQTGKESFTGRDDEGIVFVQWYIYIWIYLYISLIISIFVTDDKGNHLHLMCNRRDPSGIICLFLYEFQIHYKVGFVTCIVT